MQMLQLRRRADLHRLSWQDGPTRAEAAEGAAVRVLTPPPEGERLSGRVQDAEGPVAEAEAGLKTSTGGHEGDSTPVQPHLTDGAKTMLLNSTTLVSMSR